LGFRYRGIGSQYRGIGSSTMVLDPTAW
jgi:hypothetical protein